MNKTKTTVSFTPDELKLIVGSIKRVWQQIGHDVISSDPRIGNAAAVEGCLDQLSDSENGRAALKVLQREWDRTSYDGVVRHLAKDIRLN